MSPFDLGADVAPFRFKVGGLDPATFEVASFAGREAISEPYRFEVRLLARDPDVDPTDVLGAAATLIRHRGLERVPVHGVVAEFDLGAQGPDRAEYRAVLVPRLWRLSLAQQSRVFQDATVPDVVRAVLDDHGVPARFELADDYPRSEYVVQYQESDLAFVMRLLEREGAWFTFEHGGADGGPTSGGADVLVVADAHGRFPAIEPGPSGAPDVAYRPASGMVRDRGEGVDALAVRDRLVPGRVVLKDYNYRTPEADLTVGTAVEGGGPEEIYAYGDHYKTAAEGDRLARVRSQEIACRRRVVSGKGDVAGLRAGAAFSLSGHPRPDLDGDYLLTAVEHRGAPAPSEGDGAGGRPVYTNAFEAVPAAAPFRPARATPVPTAPGLMTARVESAGGPYAFVDEDGRYRARLALDRSGAPEAQATRPVRLVQPYSGPGYGLHLPNHAGTEMVLGFANGDLDRPIALGTVPNPAQGSPAVARNRMENVLRSWAGNALVLDDTRGGERVTLTAVKDHTESVADTQTVEVGTAQTVTVGTDRSKRVERDQSESVGGDKSIRVEGDHGESVGGDATVQVGGDDTVDVAGSATVKVGGARSETVAEDQMTAVGEGFTLQVGADASVVVADAATGRVGDRLDVRAGTEVHVEAADRLALVCGRARIVLESDGTVTIEGGALAVKGSDRITMKAPKIKEN